MLFDNRNGAFALKLLWEADPGLAFERLKVCQCCNNINI